MNYPPNSLSCKFTFSGHNAHYYDTEKNEVAILPSHITLSELQEIIQQLQLTNVTQANIDDIFRYYTEKYILDYFLKSPIATHVKDLKTQNINTSSK